MFSTFSVNQISLLCSHERLRVLNRPHLLLHNVYEHYENGSYCSALIKLVLMIANIVCKTGCSYIRGVSLIEALLKLLFNIILAPLTLFGN
jgi:hypothetical protein